MGIDPGVYTAYSILDLNGNTVKTGCAKEFSHEDLVRIISSLGKPSIIATDVSPAPDFVLRIASRFHVRVFSPQKSLLVEEKKKIGKGIRDPHIRDAYAASIKAYRHYENTLRRISSMDTPLNKDELKHLFLQGYKVSEAEFIIEKRQAQNSKAVTKRGSPLSQGNREVPPSSQTQKDERLLSLLRENENLRKALEMERGRNSSLQMKLEKATSARSVETSTNKEVQRLQGQIARMQVYISRLKRRKGVGKKRGQKGGGKPKK